MGIESKGTQQGIKGQGVGESSNPWENLRFSWLGASNKSSRSGCSRGRAHDALCPNQEEPSGHSITAMHPTKPPLTVGKRQRTWTTLVAAGTRSRGTCTAGGPSWTSRADHDANDVHTFSLSLLPAGGTGEENSGRQRGAVSQG